MDGKLLTTLAFLSLLRIACAAPAADGPQEISIQARGHLLHACYRTPEGPGPYPVMIFNHGSEKNPAPCGPADLGDLYRGKGYAFFTFQRHGHGASPGEYILDLQRRSYLAHPRDRDAAQGEVVGLHELYNQDVEAAVAWVKEQQWADSHRIAMTGISFGGIQTLLAAEKGLGVAAFIAFAPAAQSWNPVLAERLTRAVRQSDRPIFLAQAQNDYSLEPSRVLGPEIQMKGAPNRAKVYPPFGNTAQDGHWGFAVRREGIARWAPDVGAFLDACIR